VPLYEVEQCNLVRQTPLVQAFDGELAGVDIGHLMRFSGTNLGCSRSNLGGDAQRDNCYSINVAVQQIAGLDLDAVDDYRAVEVDQPRVAVRRR